MRPTSREKQSSRRDKGRMYAADKVEKDKFARKKREETWKSHSRNKENLRIWERKELYT